SVSVAAPATSDVGLLAGPPDGCAPAVPDPFLPPLVATLLLLHALAQNLEQLVEPADRLDLPLLLLGEVFLGELLEPFRRNLGAERLAHQLEPLEHGAQNAVELVKGALLLHHRRRRKISKVVAPTAGGILPPR